MVSVTKYEKSPEQALLINEQGRLYPKYPDQYTSRSQDHGHAYRYNTALIFNTAGAFAKQKDIVGLNSIPYVMPFERSIDIDYAYHIELVEILLKQQGKGV